MKFRGLAARALVALVTGAPAFAEGRNPGSLLVFPEFDTTAGRATLLTLTNTNPENRAGAIAVEIVFVNSSPTSGFVCGETNTTVDLTPFDTLTFVAGALNPNPQRGYAYAFAKNVSGEAIAFDWLIGDDLQFDGIQALDYSVNPYSFRSTRPAGSTTDVDGDGVRDLNGVEYEMAPSRILVPRFVGQSAAYQSDLVLVALTGGAQFTTMLDFLVYNDNEEVFSKNYTFRCWAKVPLASISSTFLQTFLAGFTGHAPGETIGATTVETGWFEIDGHVAWSSNTQIQDPAFLAFLVERTGPLSGAELAFDFGHQGNGDLLPLALNGDTN